ncbi:short chain dehydrogenase [Mycolicibacterium mageritense DSM 44476 = CIP 104973]|uniref:1-deoxy-11-beta-hydroxypentalenate dehydrogenase n=1 Tax=Mycolicibacterium mageritense TaxID=53462 RepID=A0AAI8U1N6_MYCME|nr:SDR family oxidoreductase [Mycolicibacterium mageritense]MCC9181199.1 SDR family oxidoreductase [Mycolicibacterium mageritense]TXI60434.1 MAG: SDR family NAD(P)-dependent oxidoreductase [Mycolicibacterium mageritense]CDO27029.1 short chain dehydrogenase [Mycolicibacterium mageritense DSM 44476 = CIP 104973]BBX38237.1 short-chain dehydrogenase [Mycolicibacterium mageritense]BDY32881.1 1-deoxy-11-beta-hydroxypentalenate dehydrogenase [Mycolicibacterium mageritense]
MSQQIEGATAVVTGGQRGLGKAIVDELLARGAAKVYATSRRPEPSTDPRVVVVEAEVTDGDSVARLAELASDATIVVNNAGVTGGKALLTDDLDEIRSVIETNLFGPLRVTRAFAPQLAGGTLVNIASVLSWLPGFGAYGISKAALWSANNSLRQELAAQGTDVVGAYLGYTDTSMVADLDVPKNDPADVARQIVDGIESGAAEVLADELTRQVRAGVFA